MLKASARSAINSYTRPSGFVRNAYAPTLSHISYVLTAKDRHGTPVRFGFRRLKLALSAAFDRGDLINPVVWCKCEAPGTVCSIMLYNHFSGE